MSSRLSRRSSKRGSGSRRIRLAREGGREQCAFDRHGAGADTVHAEPIRETSTSRFPNSGPTGPGLSARTRVSKSPSSLVRKDHWQ